MEIYLPIAGISINILTLLAIGALAGILSGMFGVGGGFITTPFLIFIGVPPIVSVSTSANQIIAASFSAFLAHLKRSTVDFVIGTLMLIGGVVGSFIGVWIMSILQKTGQVDISISLVYIFVLGSIAAFMLIDNLRVVLKLKSSSCKRCKHRNDDKKSIFRVYSHKSQITVNVFIPLSIGIFIGILVAVMGVGGGFIAVPAMIYLLGMPTNIAIGTSLYQIITTTCIVVFLQSIHAHAVDIILASLMIVSSVIGAQVGVIFGHRLKHEHLKIALSLMIIAVCVKLGLGIFLKPENLFSIETL